MKDNMKDRNLTGNTVVYYEPYHRNIVDTAVQGTITRIGTKYIHVGKLKFDMETMTSSYPHYGLYVGTLDEFREAVTLQKELLSLFDAMRRKVGIHVPLPVLRDLKNKLSDLEKRVEDGSEG